MNDIDVRICTCIYRYTHVYKPLEKFACDLNCFNFSHASPDAACARLMRLIVLLSKMKQGMEEMDHTVQSAKIEGWSLLRYLARILLLRSIAFSMQPLPLVKPKGSPFPQQPLSFAIFNDVYLHDDRFSSIILFRVARCVVTRGFMKLQTCLSLDFVNIPKRDRATHIYIYTISHP